MLLRLISFELYKIFKKWRTYISFSAIGLLVILVQIAIYYEGNFYLRQLTKSLQDNFVFVGNLLNGWLVTFFLMQFLYVHIPFLIVLVTGDLLAGEGSAGTYRFLLIRPVSRFEIILSKYLSGIIYSFLLILFLAVMSIGLGILFFGTGELLTFSDKFIIFAKDDIFWRFAYAFASAFLSMTVVAGLSFLFSSIVQNAIGPIIGTMTILIFLLIISQMDFEFLRSVSPYLFTTHMTIWQEFFNDPVDWNSVKESVIVLVSYVFIFFGITYFLFRRKDILI